VTDSPSLRKAIMPWPKKMAGMGFVMRTAPFDFAESIQDQEWPGIRDGPN
jgi:hypothetical protein